MLNARTDDFRITPPSGGQSRAARNTLIQVDIDAELEPSFGFYRVVEPEDEDDVPIDVAVAATWQRVGTSDRFVIRPEQLLDADTLYATTISARSAGLAPRLTFTTSDLIDETPPVFSFSADQVSMHRATPCGEDGTSYRVALTIEDATDDGHLGAIEYLLYLTRATGLDGPRLVSRQYAAEARDLSFTLTPEQLDAPVCVVVDAVDGVGLHADPTKIEEFCFDPLQGNFFEPCAVGGQLRASQHGSLIATIMGVLWALGVRRRRLIPLPNRSVTQR